MVRSCVLLPHGLYSLITAALTTMGWVAALFENSCNYAIVSGGIVNEVSIAEVPFLQVGLQAYTEPIYNVETMQWDTSRTGQCIEFPTTVTMDIPWKLSNGFSFVGLVLGGGATFYLWISTCCRFSKGSWRWAGYEILATCLFQLLSFLWFATDMCQNNKCELSYGSKTDILATSFWLVAALLIFCHYPKPSEALEGDGIMASSSGRKSNRRSTRSTHQRNSPQSNEPIQQEFAKRNSDEEMAAGQASKQEERRTNLT